MHPNYTIISIHASLAGGDHVTTDVTIHYNRFQSTPPSREATAAFRDLEPSPIFQSTPPSREATPMEIVRVSTGQFQSTPPSREATVIDTLTVLAAGISIHASLAGGDLQVQLRGFGQQHFNPRLPRGRRLALQHQGPPQTNFNPRLPRGRRRNGSTINFAYCAISIHASLAGGDH